MSEEIWKDIKGYEGRYKVSNLGRVLSTAQTHSRILRGHLSNNGYRRMSLRTAGGKDKSFPVHRLVLQAFASNPENKPHVDHIDNDRLNNKLENLRWATAQENARGKTLRKTVGKNGLMLSKYRGVTKLRLKKKDGSYRNLTRPYMAYIIIDAKHVHLGNFKTENEAAEARNKAVKKFYGEYARLNIIEDVDAGHYSI